MKSPIIMLLVLASFTLSCSSAGNQAPSAPAAQSVSVEQPEAVAKEQARTTNTYAARPQQISLSDAVKADTTAEAADRKIIRNADITIEVVSTSEAQHRVTSIAEAHGGFVVTSEAKQRQSADPAQR